MMSRLPPYLLSLSLLAGVLSPPGPARADHPGGDAAAGKQAAIKWCSRCHMVSRDVDLHAGIDSTPWFETFARRPEVYPPARFRSFAERPPHPPQNIRITDPEMENLIDYVKTLRPE